MRHRNGLRKLNITDGAHRRMMFRHMSNAVIRHERIKTTLTRAKELRRYLEPLITLGKKPSVARRRLAFARLQDRQSVVKLFDELGVRFAARAGGYLRILKCGYRAGDGAPMALIELTEKRATDGNDSDKNSSGSRKAKSAGKAKKTAAAAAAEEIKTESADNAEDGEKSDNEKSDNEPSPAAASDSEASSKS